MKKPVLLVALAAGMAALVQRRRAARADQALWREATDSDPATDRPAT
jgi:hypothetical protein